MTTRNTDAGPKVIEKVLAYKVHPEGTLFEDREEAATELFLVLIKDKFGERRKNISIEELMTHRQWFASTLSDLNRDTIVHKPPVETGLKMVG